jgi:hypothetical protein
MDSQYPQLAPLTQLIWIQNEFVVVHLLTTCQLRRAIEKELRVVGADTSARDGLASGLVRAATSGGAGLADQSALGRSG